MKVAITDYSFPNLDVEEGILCPQGHQIAAWKEKHSALQLPELLADADAVITQFAPLTADVIQSMQRARVIVRYGIGVDNVDLLAAKARGIPVCNVPDYCIDEVADQTLAFMLATTRQVLSNCHAVREGRWGLATPLEQMRTLRDLTVGLVGFGRIGREVAARLQPFHCRVLVHDPAVTDAAVQKSGCHSARMDQLFAESDLISLHCPSMPQTRGMINRDSLSAMKQGAILINVARGDLIDSDALCEALLKKHLSAAALDVFTPEPIPSDHPMLQMENVIFASHIASCSVRAVRTLRETAATIAAMALRGEPLPNIVNGVGKST
ncbi:MAG: C-terminal binding protein [Planctomycetota bacterium]|jgi:D-3-phosphoglycerate dehydrogenase / 2-oxoglutarate reductase|nr:C-terminal binding protein [Pirellulales bacterium]